jgi:hypothetical protein
MHTHVLFYLNSLKSSTPTVYRIHRIYITQYNVLCYDKSLLHKHFLALTIQFNECIVHVKNTSYLRNVGPRRFQLTRIKRVSWGLSVLTK